MAQPLHRLVRQFAAEVEHDGAAHGRVGQVFLQVDARHRLRAKNVVHLGFVVIADRAQDERIGTGMTGIDQPLELVFRAEERIGFVDQHGGAPELHRPKQSCRRHIGNGQWPGGHASDHVQQLRFPAGFLGRVDHGQGCDLHDIDEPCQNHPQCCCIGLFRIHHDVPVDRGRNFSEE